MPVGATILAANAMCVLLRVGLNRPSTRIRKSESKMLKNFLPIVAVLLVSACSQLTTNKTELAAMQQTAEGYADEYVDCVKQAALANAATNRIDVAAAVNLASSSCAADMASYKEAQTKVLEAQFLMTEKPVQQAIDQLNERAEQEVSAALLAAGSQAADPVPVAAAAAGASAAAVATAAPVSATGTDWSADQRVYLDCMEDQAGKYASLQESATVVADVAHSRCNSYATGAGSTALINEGRALVMGTVMDAKLQAQPGNGSQP